MLHWLVDKSLTLPKAVAALAIAVMALGVWQLPQAKVDALPEFAPVTVQIQTEALGLSAQEVEQMITVPSSRTCSTAWRGWSTSTPNPSPGCPRST